MLQGGVWRSVLLADLWLMLHAILSRHCSCTFYCLGNKLQEMV